MTQYTVRGQFQSRDGWKPFETVVDAQNENVATEHCYATLGSRHGLKRIRIDIEEVAAE